MGLKLIAGQSSLYENERRFDFLQELLLVNGIEQPLLFITNVTSDIHL